MDALDLRISRKLQKLLQRVERLAEKEIGERVGIAMVVFPFTREGEESRMAEYQYVCNVPRSHMHGAMKALVEKWDKYGVAHNPPHLRQ